MKAIKLVVLMTVAFTYAVVFGETYNDGNGLIWTYTAKSGNATLSGVERENGESLAGALVIPSSVGSSTVTAIGERFCAGTAIESLTIASTVTTIEKGAFADIAIWKEDEFSSSATYVEPHKFSRGVKAVLVNGAVSYADGKFSANRTGRFLERKQ